MVVLIDAVGDRQRRPSNRGRATFRDVLVGPIEVHFVAPHFHDLRWSAARVPVGEPADAIFRFDDAAAGMEALVVVYEVNADGREDEVARLPVVLEAESGQASVTFTRSEEEAQADVLDDEAEGDVGPVEYRYRVYAEGDRSAASDALWLTHTVLVELDDVASKGAPAAGLTLLLLAPDGTEHRAPLHGGRAKVHDVVCGPMTLRVVAAGGEG
jgi:hypothetical protein